MLRNRFRLHKKTRMLLSPLALFTCLSLLYVSPAYAVGDWLKAQPSLTVTAIVGALTALLLVVLILFFSARGKATRALRNSEDMTSQRDEQASLLMGLSTGVLHLDSQQHIIYANRVAAYLFNAKPEQLQGKRLQDLLSDEDAQYISRIISSGVFTRHQSFLHARKRHVDFGVTPKFKLVPGIDTVIVIEDVTELQGQVDDKSSQLSDTEQLLRDADIGRLKVDFEHDQVDTDDTFETLIGELSEKLDGSLNTLRQVIGDKDLVHWNKAVEEARQGQPIDLKCRIKTVTGDVLCQLSSTATLADEEGKVQHIHIAVLPQNELAEAQQRIDQLSQRIKHLLVALPSAVYVVDEEQQLTECNAAFEKMFATKLSKIEGQPVTELSCFAEQIKALHSTKETQRFSVSSAKGREVQCELANGKQATLRFHLKPYKSAVDNRGGTIVIVEDISELREAEAIAEMEQKRFSNLIDLAPLGIAIIDQNDHITRANLTLQERLGLNEKELAEQDFYQLFYDPSNAGKAARNLHSSGRLRDFQATLKGKGGVMHPSELQIDLFDRQAQSYLCWVADTSDKQFQVDKFDNLLEHSGVPMAVLSTDGFTRINPAACEFFALDREQQLLGKYPYEESINVGHDEVIQLKAKIEQVELTGRAQTMPWEFILDGSTLPCQATYVPMFRGRELESVLCIWMDMRALTEADKARQEALSKAQQAEQEASEKLQMLKSSQQELASKAKSLAETESQLQAAKQDLTEKQSQISDLQQAHDEMTANLEKLQGDYTQSREMLAAEQANNAELEAQLEQSTAKVSGLEKQRNQIADALQNSEKQFQRAKQQLAESEQTTKRLELEREEQKQQLQQYADQIDSLKSDIQSKDQQIHDVSGQISHLQSQLASSSQTSDKLKQALINQRKASEQAEKQRRELEQAWRLAESEATNKARHIEHLQHEMHKFEELSNQQKGDLEQQQQALQEELEAKQRQLQETMQALEASKRESEQEKAEKEAQRQHFEKLQAEIQEAERRAEEQQAQMAEADKKWQQQQQALQSELADKQNKLLETEKVLLEAQRQSEKEKAEKEAQQRFLEQLKAEMAEVEKRTAEQQAQIAEAEQRYQQQQQELQRELEEKQRRLQETEQGLLAAQKQAEADKAERAKQQEIFDKLKSELQEVEKRTSEQERKHEESDEQWQQRQRALQQELENKQQQLAKAQSDIEDTRRQAEQEREEKARQQQIFDKQKAELAELEKRTEEQQRKMAESDQHWRETQAAMQQELEAKQQQLADAQAKLEENERQAEAERAEKERQQQIFEQLKAELQEVESRSNDQQRRMAETDDEWQQRQQQMQQELEAKQQELLDARTRLEENQRQSDEEKLARLAQQKKLEQLKVELSDVELRATKQKEMMEGSDEQWRQHREEIEQQKAQLQKALEEAKRQNEAMQSKLKGSLSELKQAESQVNETRSAEQKLQDELNAAKHEAEELQKRLKQQEKQELALQQQLAEQQKALQAREANINNLESAQKQLTEKLRSVQNEYQQTKASLSKQDNSQSELAEQLKTLEQELQQSKQQLTSKEQALVNAQQQLQSSKSALKEQEQALVAAHKEELKQAQQMAKQAEGGTPSDAKPIPEFAKQEMPDSPEIWFDLLPYLQKNPHAGSLAQALTKLMDELETCTNALDDAVQNENLGPLVTNGKNMLKLAQRINSEPLIDMATRLEADATGRNIDSISIFWPTFKRALMSTLRVIYSHVNG